ncbi:MAG: hypothetical protein K8R77_04600 [Anaerolineaceae bacterium]|nr:hypothetical protein [Anaerolineaceae bacterium]
MSKTIALVSCVKSKLPGPMPAGEIYCSTWFKKASAYAKSFADGWYILSAKYYVLDPTEVIEEYNLTLKTMRKAEKLAWSYHVLQQIQNFTNPGDHLIILAGNDYRKYLTQPLKELGFTFEIPMEGLRQGEQMMWLTQQLEESK